MSRSFHLHPPSPQPPLSKIPCPKIADKCICLVTSYFCKSVSVALEFFPGRLSVGVWNFVKCPQGPLMGNMCTQKEGPRSVLLDGRDLSSGALVVEDQSVELRGNALLLLNLFLDGENSLVLFINHPEEHLCDLLQLRLCC
ncbi:hypothetical protein CEXT_559191 [Caerostris extrusa]|uniref:Uncharacterized protein n=1 Tax=Caerostris extrusa TaxID=172846 RepID=A0AAV4NY16_CAEEX|nr:hypothetical protein CEXT_559191 [Caerostris extrusa]